MKTIIMAMLLMSGCVGPACMSATDCKTMCGDAGTKYFGPTRGSNIAECICNVPNAKLEP